MQYTLYIERDPQPDLKLYPDGIAYVSGVLDENGQLIDGEGNIASYEDARELALSTLERLIPQYDNFS